MDGAVTLTPKQRDMITAYIVDRAEQYGPESASQSALYELVRAIRSGEAELAFAHGELDDIMVRFGYPKPEEAA